MAFWSSQTLESKGQQLIEPFRKERIHHAAYELSVGPEAYIPSDRNKTTVELGSPITIPPGQFGLLITREIVTVPKNAIAFISIRAGTKFRGLVNVSGFHVDPGYSDRLMFSVYNAASQPIILGYDQPVFMIWYADLDAVDEDPYLQRTGEPKSISPDDMMKIQGEVASPAELKKQLDKLKDDFEKRTHEIQLDADQRIHELETKAEQRLHNLETNTDKRVHSIETRQQVVQTLLGAVLIALLVAIVSAMVKYWVDGGSDRRPPSVPAQAAPVNPPANP